MIALGLMSGTSADGVSAAVVDLRPRRAMRLLSHLTVPYPKALRERVLAARDARTPELSALHADLGRFFARVAVKAIGRRKIGVVGSHGQTVWHAPGKHTLQIGEASFIAEATGVTTVCDFRAADLAAGGQGAPLVPYLDWVLFGGTGIIALNVGGLANVTIAGRRLEDTIGFDTGPGNCLIDEAMRAAYGKPFDRDGRVAASGRVDDALLRRLHHPWLRKPPPKSTGRELWSLDFLLARAGPELRKRPADVVATLTAFTAKTVADALDGRNAQEVVVSGGGLLNATLMRELEARLWPAVPRPCTVYGLPPLAKEPVAFALLAAERVRGVPTGMPSVTGARRSASLGKVVT